MTESTKATRATVWVGSLKVDGFQLPDGSYRMSLTQASGAVELSARNAFDFLRSKAIKSLLGEGYTVSVSEVEIESTEQSRGQGRFRAMPLEAVGAYWLWQSYRGNRKALALCMTLITETLERRFDSAFGIERTEAEYNEALSAQVFQLEGDLAKLSEAYAEPDVLKERVSRLEQQLLDAGIEPFSPPDSEDA